VLEETLKKTGFIYIFFFLSFFFFYCFTTFSFFSATSDGRWQTPVAWGRPCERLRRRKPPNRVSPLETRFEWIRSVKGRDAGFLPAAASGRQASSAQFRCDLRRKSLFLKVGRKKEEKNDSKQRFLGSGKK
jgi:hypothetical protein